MSEGKVDLDRIALKDALRRVEWHINHPMPQANHWQLASGEWYPPGTPSIDLSDTGGFFLRCTIHAPGGGR